MILQRIVLDYHHLAHAKNLYVRSAENSEGTISFSTDTYINIFHYRHWKLLANINRVWLNVRCLGKGILHLVGHHASVNGNISCTPHQDILASVLVENSAYQEIYQIELNDSYDFYSLLWEHYKNDTFHIIDANYSTSYSTMHRTIHMAIVTTTYKRYDDIHTLADTYRSACLNFIELQDATHLFIINNDSSDSKIQNIMSHNITVFNNPCNLGGSGGFARGAQYAVADGRFSHILFMDDDALIHEESWLRSLSLLSTLKDIFYDAPLAGAMFNSEIPAFCQTLMEALDKNFHRVLQYGEVFVESSAAVNRLLSSAHNILAHPDTIPLGEHPIYPYAAWWYAIFPVTIFKKYGYPAPYFFRGDDQEFGIRIGKHLLFLNGICIWHPPFEPKKSALRQYLGLRNFLLTVARHHKQWKRVILHEVFVKMTYSLANKDYEYAAVILLAIKDFYVYSQIPQDGEQLIPRVQSVILEFPNRTISLPIKEYRIFSQSNKTRISFFAVWCTAGGSFIPPCLRRRCVICRPQQISASWAAQCVAYPQENVGRTLQPRLAIKLWGKSLFSLGILLFASKKLKVYTRERTDK